MHNRNRDSGWLVYYWGSIHFLGVLRRQLCLLATAEFWIPSLKSSAEFVIEDVHAHLQ